MKKTKIFAVALAALLLTGTLAACEDADKTIDNNIESTENTSPSTGNEGNVIQPAESGLSAYEWKHADDEVVLTIDGKDIDFATYRYYVMNFKPQYDMGNDGYWNEETEAQFKSDMLEEIKKLVAIEKVAKDKGITLSEDEIKGITDYLEEFIATYGEDVYKQQMDISYLTKDVYVDTNMYNLYLEDLYLAAASNEQVKNYANENYVHVKHVLVSTMNENNKELTGEAFDEKTKLANDISERAKNGEDFDALVKQYGEDPGMQATPEGYTFTYGMMVKEFEDKSFELAVGEISEPVKTSYGYHIIQKLPIDFDALIDETNQTYWEIVSAIAASPVQSEVAAKAASFEVVETEIYKNLTAANIGIRK